MSSLLPLASFNLAIEPYVPTPALESDLPMTVRLTLAAIDPNSIDDDEQPSTLRILKSSPLNRLALDSDDEDYDSEEESGEESGEESDEEMKEDEEEKDASDDEEKSGSESGSDDEDDSDLEDDEDVEEYVICTLSPKTQYQQTLELTISPEEEIYFVVTGSYPIHLTGNYVDHPFDGEEDDFDSDDYDSEEEDSDFDSDEYDLTPDEEELAEGEFDINDLENESDVEGKIEELVEEDEKKQQKSKKENKKESKKESKKRQAEEEEEAKPEPKETKKQKKEKAKEEEKKVQFNEELEQGPTKTEEKKKPAVKTLAGGVTIEDRTVGKGAQAKNGNKVGVRYIGKLKNGSVFDKNTSGKPFQFTLGKGEVIKGWDIGVAGMAVGGERRIVIPAPYAYGKKKLPGIPANSELTFDVKLVNLK